MSTFACDLHIHSCLSPCADEDMTPFSIAGMARLNGLDIAALTDHNSCGNCAPFFAACERYGVVPVAGMELTTSEDVHLLCLFASLEDALSFDRAVDARRVRMRNRPEVFGRQVLIGMDDEPAGEEEHLLVNATTLMLAEAAALARSFGGAPVPAHIDREANGVLSVLGDLPPEIAFAAVEYREAANVAACEARRPGLIGKRRIVSSDAHRLWDIAEGGWPVDLPCGADADGDGVRRALIAYLSGAGPQGDRQ